MDVVPDYVGNQDYDQYRYLLFALPLALNAHRIVETGLSIGHSTRIFLTSLHYLPGDRELHTYEINPLPDTVQQIHGLGLKPKWVIHEQDSTKPAWGGEQIDLLYLDADHAYESVKQEVDAFGKCLTHRSVILTHDAYPSTTGTPSPTHHALEEWADTNGWRTMLFTYPEGMAMVYHDN